MRVSYCGRGVTRQVVLVGRWALKFPRVNCGWRIFLQGLLANMAEAVWGTTELEGFCPVVLAVPGGFLTVQRRARVLTVEEYAAFDVRAFIDREHYTVPAEEKRDSFGWLDGQIVAIDYGS